MMTRQNSSPFPVVHVYTLCWNEAIMLPHFLRHYAWAERIFVYDNMSDDKSRHLVKSASNSEIRDFNTGGRYSEETLTEFRNQAWKQSRGRADFVIVCDVDEFLHHPDLAGVLNDMKHRGATLLLPTAYQMVGDHVPTADENLLETMPHGVRLHNYDKCLLFAPEIDDINFGLGAHVCRPVGRIAYFRVPGLMMLHYKYLSFDYVWNRNRLYTARTSDADKARSFSPQHRLSREDLTRRFELLRNNRIDAVALAKRWSGTNSWKRVPESLPSVYREGVRAFRLRNYSEAYEKISYVADWVPGRLRIDAVIAVIARMRDLFFMESEHVLRRAVAMTRQQFSSVRALMHLARFYHRSNHPRFALHCIDKAARLEPDNDEVEVLRRRILAAKD